MTNAPAPTTTTRVECTARYWLKAIFILLVVLIVGMTGVMAFLTAV